jgi:hypothetical protein
MENEMATTTKPEPAQQAQQPQPPFVRLSDGAASEQTETVTFILVLTRQSGPPGAQLFRAL